MFRRPISASRFRKPRPVGPESWANPSELADQAAQQGAESPAGDTQQSSAGRTESNPLGNLEATLDAIEQTLTESLDLVLRRIEVDGRPAALAYLNGMVDKQLLSDGVLRPLRSVTLPDKGDVLAWIDETVLFVPSTERVSKLDEVLAGVLEGKTALLIDGSPECVLVCAQGWVQRTILDPQSEVAVRGPRESFSENVVNNIALIRRRIRDSGLATEELYIGQRTRTKVAIAYIGDIADGGIVDEVRTRLNRIDTDSILDSGYIEQFIEDAPFSPFATVGYSERPDVIAGRLLEGRVAILIDGSPQVLTVPYLFVEGMQTAEDYYSRTLLMSMTRLFRYVALVISITAPAVFIAAVNFHPEMIPTALLLTLSSAREGLPLPLIPEMLLLGGVFQVVREAGIRLPKPVGQAVSIAGVIVVGDAAVSAGLVGPASVITVALTAIASFNLEPLTEPAFFVRLLLILLSSIFGGFGLVVGLVAALIHVSSLRSFGVPYLAPLSPPQVRGVLQDTFLRAPIWMMRRRPAALSPAGSIRQGAGQRPEPPVSPQGSPPTPVSETPPAESQPKKGRQ